MINVIETRKINGENYNLIHSVGDEMSSLYFQSVEKYIETDEGSVAKSSKSDWLVSESCFSSKQIDVSMHNSDSLKKKMKNIDNAISENNITDLSSYF